MATSGRKPHAKPTPGRAASARSNRVAASGKQAGSKALKLSKRAKTSPAAQAGKPLAGEVTDEMFEVAADTFRIMSAPLRLRIINSLCEREKFVGELLEEIPTTQPNMSQHLNALFTAKILGRRREGVQIYYRLINDQVVTICRAMCQHVSGLVDPLGDQDSG